MIARMDKQVVKITSHRAKLPFWAIYFRAVGFVFIGLIAADWVRYWLTDEWVHWAWVALGAALWPAVITAIT
jgi:uncharacterized membrane protein YcjF (UPF0283 family)